MEDTEVGGQPQTVETETGRLYNSDIFISSL